MPETVVCNLCRNADPEPQPQIGAFLGVPDPFSLVRCGSCGLFFLSPRATLEELGTMYANHPYYAADNAFRGETRQAFYDAKINRLERYVPGRGRVLGIGCLEGGYALQVAQDRGSRTMCVLTFACPSSASPDGISAASPLPASMPSTLTASSICRIPGPRFVSADACCAQAVTSC